MPKLSPFVRSAIERICSTAVAAAVSAASVYVSNLPPQWVPVGTVAFEVVRSLVAKWRGNPDDASLLKG